MTNMCVMAANRLIEKTNTYNNSVDYCNKILMTCKRLQKLLFFSEVIYMQKHDGQPMFSDEFYAWPSGPVIPSVYDKFMQYQDGKMLPVLGYHTPLDQDMEDVLEEVFKKTRDIETEKLVEMSHIPRGPWAQVYDPDDSGHFQIVTKKSMYEFYKNKDVLC